MPGHPACQPDNPSEPSYNSLELDLKARFSKGITIPKGPARGGLIVEVSETSYGASTDAGSPSKSPGPFHSLHSNDKFYDVKGITITDRVRSAKTLRNSVVSKQTGHISMDMASPTDPRQTHVKPAARPEVGPGAYDVDPMAMYTTGMPELTPGQSHHMTAFEKDPTRPSPAFKSHERGRSAHEVTAERVQQRVGYMLPPDYESWTSKGYYSSRSARVIESERWGRSVREPRPAPSASAQSVYDPQVSSDGRTNSITAYTSQKNGPSYKVAFGSGMPRLVSLPANLRQDTRTVATHAGATTGTSNELGPGVYDNLDVPRFHSFNAALEDAPQYFSLASGSPPFHLSSPRGGRNDDSVPEYTHSGGLSPAHLSSLAKQQASFTSQSLPQFRASIAQSKAASYAGSSMPQSPAMTPSPYSPSMMSHHAAPWAAGAVVTQVMGPSPITSPVRTQPLGDDEFALQSPDPLSPGGNTDVGVVVGAGADADWEVHRAVVEAQRVGVTELRGAATRERNRAVANHPSSWASELASPTAPTLPVSVLPGTGSPLALSVPTTPAQNGVLWGGSLSMPPSPTPSAGAGSRSARASVPMLLSPSRPATVMDGVTLQAQELQASRTVALAAAAAMASLPSMTQGNRRFSKLMFLRREVPQGDLMRGELIARADLRRARAQAAEAGQAH